MTNRHCHFLSNGYTLNVRNDELTWRPCCLYTKRIPFQDKTALVQEQSHAHGATAWIPECGECQRIESLGQPSMRDLSRQRVQGEFLAGQCVSLEINFDKKCNAACLSCAADFSSTWEKYNRKWNLDGHVTTVDAQQLLDQFTKSVPLNNLQFLYLQGGEPFYSATHQYLLEHVLEVHPAPETVTVHYQTNGSLFPESAVVDMWQRFKTVVINFSIDDIQDRFEYLRWPLDWEQLNQTVQRFIQTTGVDFRVNSTINPLNAIYYDQLENWIVSTFPKQRLLGYRAGACLGNLDLRKTPLALRQHIRQKFGSKHRISVLFDTPEVFDYDDMLKYLQLHDLCRKQQWQTRFQKSVEFFQ